MERRWRSSIVLERSQHIEFNSKIILLSVVKSVVTENKGVWESPKRRVEGVLVKTDCGSGEHFSRMAFGQFLPSGTKN